MADEGYRDVEAALRAAVELPSAKDLGLVEAPLALENHPTLTSFQRIGRGGMGVVFRAHDRTLGCEVAVKLLRPGLHDTQATRRLQREGRTLLNLHHPRIVALHRIEEHEGRLLLIMELVLGLPLTVWLRREARELGALRKVLADCAEALAFAHTQALVHRDFKPANVMVRTDDTACVLDFGLARRVPSADSAPGAADTFATLTAPGTLLGTTGYMAPELLQGERGDARSDQYSFAVTACEVLGSSVPQADWPSGLVDALSLAQSTDPSQRHPTMEVLLAALRAT